MRGFRPFSGSPGLRAGSGAADFLHARHPIPQSRSAPAGGWNPRPRSWPWSWRWQIREARQHVCSVGAGRGTPAAGTGCWQTGMARSVPVRRDPGACLPDKAGVCLSGSRGGQSDADTGVGRPESGGADECRVRLRPDARPAGICVGQSTEPRRRFAGKRRLLRVRALCRVCPQKMKGAPKGSLPHQKLTLKNYPLFGRPP